MFSNLIRRLSGPSPVPPAPPARLALAALLVRLARIDGHYAPEERLRIAQILSGRYGMTAEEAALLRSDAEALEAEASDNVRFTRAIKEAVPHENREDVMEALWDLVLTDGTRDQDEDAAMRLLASLLGITDQDSAHARRRVEARRK